MELSSFMPAESRDDVPQLVALLNLMTMLIRQVK